MHKGLPYRRRPPSTSRSLSPSAQSVRSLMNCVIEDVRASWGHLKFVNCENYPIRYARKLCNEANKYFAWLNLRLPFGLQQTLLLSHFLYCFLSCRSPYPLRASCDRTKGSEMRCILIARPGPKIEKKAAPFAAFRRRRRRRVISVWKIDRLVMTRPRWGGLDDSRPVAPTSSSSSCCPPLCMAAHIKLHKCQATVMTTSCKRPIIFIINDINALLSNTQWPINIFNSCWAHFRSVRFEVLRALLIRRDGCSTLAHSSANACSSWNFNTFLVCLILFRISHWPRYYSGCCCQQSALNSKAYRSLS